MKKGFTLIELLAVIVILAIIMVITIPRVLDALSEAKISAFRSDLVGIYKSLEKQINESQLDLNDVLPDSANFATVCPTTFWAESKPVCKYSYTSANGIYSLIVRVDWDFDLDYDYVTYDGLNYEYIVPVE